MSQNADDWVWKVPSQPPTRAQVNASCVLKACQKANCSSQQYSRAGPQQRQEKQTFDNGTSFRHRPDVSSPNERLQSWDEPLAGPCYTV